MCLNTFHHLFIFYTCSFQHVFSKAMCIGMERNSKLMHAPCVLVEMEVFSAWHRFVLMSLVSTLSLHLASAVRCATKVDKFVLVFRYT